MKVFLTSTDNPYAKQVGGKHIHQLLFEKGLKELGHELHLFYPTFPKRPKYETAFRLLSKGLPLNSYGFLTYRLKIDAQTQFAKAVTESKTAYDILHAQDPTSILYTQNIEAKKRILTLHGYLTRECINYSQLSGKYANKFFDWGMAFEKEAYKLADAFVCADSTIRDYLISEFRIPESKIMVVFNAIDTNRFAPPTSIEIEKLKKENGLEGKFVVLVPRRLVHKNGVHIAVRAMKQIADDKLVLLIAGDGPERSMIESERGNDQRIRLLGSVDHSKVIDYFKLTDCVLIPSITSTGFQEATSLAMLEGMSMSKPTICSAIGGMKEVIRHNETGFLVDEQKPDAIAAQINWIRNNGSESELITRNARAYILENHHYVSHAKKIASLYY